NDDENSKFIIFIYIYVCGKNLEQLEHPYHIRGYSQKVGTKVGTKLEQKWNKTKKGAKLT
ncbi:MAG: hypothetical protein L0K95_14110, partial [Tetragenococcus koreensis]|nr:hypothetical protein [Tetragenococcus koreensis]